MKRLSLPTLALLVALLLTGLAGAQGYGTVVDEAWYDQVAEAYQDPASTFDGRYFSSHWKYREAYAPLSLERTISDDGTVTFAPAEDGNCTLLGTAGLIERLIRNRVGTLQNVASGDGANTFKQDALALATLELVAFEDSSFGIRDNPAVVIANGVRYFPFDVDYGTPGDYGITRYTATFSLATLREAGAIIDDTLTIATGVIPSARCEFDLTQLP